MISLSRIYRYVLAADDLGSGKAREERKGTLEMVYDYLGSNEVAVTEQPTASPIFAPPASLAVRLLPTISITLVSLLRVLV